MILDHRALAWEDARGRAAIERLHESSLSAFSDLWLDAVEVLACDERVLALRYSLGGHGTDGGGEMEVAQGAVVLADDERLVSVELCDIDDRSAMLARYEELGGRYELGDGSARPDGERVR